MYFIQPTRDIPYLEQVLDTLPSVQMIHIDDISLYDPTIIAIADSLAKVAEPVADGLVELRDDALILLPQGQLMMRNVAMAFDAYLGGEQRGRFSRTV